MLTTSVAHSVIGFLIVMVVSVSAYYLVAKLRDSNSNNHLDPETLQKNFEEMRSGGDIDEAEFRNIKALLAGADPKSVPPRRNPAGAQSDEAS